jgi:hypothetical protein
MFTSCSPPVLRECINNNNTEQQQQVIKHSVIKCLRYALCVSVVSWVVFLSQRNKIFEENSWRSFRSSFFTTTYALNIFFFLLIHFLFARSVSLCTHTHTPLIVVLLRLRALLQRASNFGGEKSEWCGRALFYAALNFDHLPFITRTKQERISFLPQGGLVWGTTNFSLLLF